ncbi:MAG: pyruvate dehydrogenase E2 component (dihydrolipoamide acetyltransferase) [Saprospiraceae bacterium]|jgi:pyruvate dehydrogenase E2 component (dihydrolipoamide acetyltransferase)
MAEVMLMPLLSDTMTEGTVAAWHKQVGDEIEIGELLLEIETDKAVMEQDSFFEGTLLHIGVQEGETVAVKAVLAVIGEKGEDFQADLAAALAAADGTPAESVAPEAPVVETPAVQEEVTANDDNSVKSSPLARKMAKEEGLNLSDVKGSGENGRIVKRDIEAALENRSATPAPAAVTVAPTTPPPPPVAAFGMEGPAYEDVKLSNMRKVIARRLGESKYSAPHFYLTVAINMDNAISTRKRLNEISPSKISFNDLVVKACAVSLREHPAINASWLGDSIRYNKVYNIGIAVAVDEGLVVPVIRHADMKSLSQISAEVKDKARKAIDRKLPIEDMQGNTFSISNLGMFGIEEFTAIINPPDSCILAVGGISQVPVVKDGEIKVGNIMKVTLSCDHRVVDGASGAKFLNAVKALLEDPIRMMV